MLVCAACFEPLSPTARKCPRCGHVASDADVFKTRYRTKDLLKLGLSKTLADFVMHEPRRGIFNYYCGEKYLGWLCIPKDVSAIYPLWSLDGNLTVVWVRNGVREFVQTYLDGDVFLGNSEQALLAHLFRPIMEHLDWENVADTAKSKRKLVKAAAQLNFKYMEELLRLFELLDQPDSDDDQPDSYDVFDQQFDELVTAIDKQNA